MWLESEPPAIASLLCGSNHNHQMTNRFDQLCSAHNIGYQLLEVLPILAYTDFPIQVKHAIQYDKADLLQGFLEGLDEIC